MPKPRIWIDPTRFKLIPENVDHEEVHHQPKAPDEIMHRYSTYHKRDFETPRHLTELKEKIKYREEQFVKHRNPMYDKYSRFYGENYSPVDEGDTNKHNPDIHSEKPRRQHDFY